MLDSHNRHDDAFPHRPEQACDRIRMKTILALSLVTNIGANAAVKAASLVAKKTDTAMARLGSGMRLTLRQKWVS